jgi:NAD(P)-dependent dehydrogenase (short-subunit alcohol dehydrogenase family)
MGKREGNIALVTAGNSGIGLATAKRGSQAKACTFSSAAVVTASSLRQ